MNEEEMKAIENLKRKLKSNKKYFEIEGFYLYFNFETEKEIKLLINLIEKQQKEIQYQKDINKTEQDRHKQTEKSLKGQIVKKDKIMRAIIKAYKQDVGSHSSVKSTIEYFKNKVEREEK